MTNATAITLREEIEKTEKELIRKRTALKVIEDRCRPHSWGEIDNRVDVQKAYTIAAVELGVDSTPEMHVPENRVVYHRRRCIRCGLIEETTETKVARVERVPDFEMRR